MAVDDRGSNVQSQGTLADIRPMQIFSSGELEDGDHQFWGHAISSPVNALIVVHYFECVVTLLHPVPDTVPSQSHRFRIENSSGGGFNFISDGPNSPDVPAQAVTVDNTSPDIILQNASQWTLTADTACYEKTRWWSTVPGASLSYSFAGVAIWYEFIHHTI